MRALVIIIGILWMLNAALFSQEWSTFNCDGSGKCQGVKFSIKYPINWQKSGGTNSSIVQNFGHAERRGYVKMVVYLDRFDEIPTPSDVDELYSKDHLLKYYSTDKLIEFNDQATIQGEKCVTATIQVEDKMYDQVVRSIVKTNMLIWKDSLFQINFFIFSNDQSYETMTAMYNDYNEVFKEIVVSLVILSKWEK
jgi:hypothetical protein